MLRPIPPSSLIRLSLVALATSLLAASTSGQTVNETNSEITTVAPTVPTTAANLLSGATLAANPTSPFVTAGSSTAWGVLIDGVYGAAGTGGTGPANTAWLSPNNTLTYTFNTTANPFGYTIANIDAYTGWDINRIDQSYSVYYSTVSNPTFTLLKTVSYAHPSGSDTGLQVDLAMTTLSGVAAIQFVAAGSQQSGFVGYRELAVAGSAGSVWNGGGGTDNWTDAANWGGTAPAANMPVIFSGTTRLSPVNNFAANTQFSTIGFASGAGAFTLPATGNAINLTGNVINSSSSLQTVNIPLALQTNVSLNAASGGLAFGGVISGASGVTLPGANTVTFAAANTYSGGTTISAGTLQLGDGTNNGSVAGDIVNNGALKFNNAASQSYPGIISGSGSLTKVGAGVLSLSANNSYTGTTVVNGGTLRLNAAAGHVVSFTSVGSTTWTDPAGVTSVQYLVVGGGGGGGAETGAGGGGGGLLTGTTSVTAGTGYAVMVGAGGAGGFGYENITTLGSNGGISVFGSFTAIGGGAGGSNGGHAASQAGTVGGSGGGGSNGSVGSAGTSGQGFAGGASGNFSTQVTAGGGGGAGAVGSAGSANGGNGGGGLSSNISGTTVFYAGGGGGGNYNGSTGGTGGSGGGGNGGIANGTATASLNASGSGGSYGGGGGGQGGNGGASHLAGGSGFQGVVYLSYTPSYVLPATTALQVSSGSTLDLFGTSQPVGSLADFGGGGGTVTNTAVTPAALTLAPTSGSTTFSGAITDGGGSSALTLNLTGAGTQVLAGANTYSGATNILAGSLRLTGSLGALSAVGVGGGTASGTPTLTGTGTASGAVTINGAGGSGAAGHLAPGLNTPTSLSGAIGTLTVGSLTLNSGAVLDYDFGAPGSPGSPGSSDLVSMTGALTLPSSGAVTLNLYNLGSALGNGTYKLFGYSSINNFSNTIITIGSSGGLTGRSYSFSSVNSNTELDLTIATEAWTGLANTGAWQTPGNWVGNAVPGVNTGAINSTDTATFNSAGNSQLNITPDASRNVQFLAFDTSMAAAYVVGTTGGSSILLTNNGGVLTTSTVANTETVNAPLVIEGTAATFTSGSPTSPLQIGGGITSLISGGGTTTLTLNGASSGAAAGTISGVIADNGTTHLALVKADAGTWILSNANTYTGGTTISNGTLQLGDGTNNGSVVGNILNNSALTFKNGSSQTYSGVISGSGSLNVNGTAPLILNGLNTHLGATMIASGASLQLGDGTTNNGTVGGAIVNNAALTFANPNAQSFSGAISGSGALTKSAAGVLTLSSAASYSGATVISGGTLRLNPTAVTTSFTTVGTTPWIAPTGVNSLQYLVVAGGGGGGDFTGGGGGGGGVLTGTTSVTAGTGYTVTVGAGGAGGFGGNTSTATGSNGGNSTFGAFAATGGGGGGSNGSGASAAGLSGGSGGGGSVAATGGTGINGQGFAGGASANWNSPNPTGGGGGAGGVGAVGTSAGGGNGGGGLSSSITGSLVYYAGGGGGGIFASSTGGIGGQGGGGNGGIQGGTPTASLNATSFGGGGGGQGGNSGAQAGSGFAGTVVLSYAPNILPITTPVQIAGGSTLDLFGANQTVGSLADFGGSGGSIIDSAAGPSVLTLSPSGGSTSFSGVIGGGSGAISLVMSGNGTQILTGANTYAGATNVQNGALVLGTSGSNVGSLPATTTVTLGSGTSPGLLQLGDASNPVNQTVAGLAASGTGTANFIVGGNSGISTLTVNNSSTVTYAGNLGGSGTNQSNLGLTKSGAGVLRLAGVNAYTGPTAINAGTLTIVPVTTAQPTGAVAKYSFNNNANDSVGPNNGTLVNSPTFVTSGVIGKAINFSGANQSVAVNYNSSLGVLGNYTISFWENLNSTTQVGSATFFSTRQGVGGGTDIQYSPTAGLHGDIGNSAGTGLVNTTANGTGPLPSGWNMITYAISPSAYSIYVNGNAFGSGTFSGSSLLMASTATLTIGNNGSQFGNLGINAQMDELNIFPTTLNPAQVTSLYNARVGYLPTLSDVSIANTATFDLNGGQQQVASLSGPAGSTVTNGGATAATLTIALASGSGAFAGTIQDGSVSGTTAVQFSGAAGTVQTLTGANTYTGGTTLTGGTLSLGSSGAIGTTGAISFNGGTLQFTAANTTDYSGRFSNAANQAYSVDTNSQNVSFAGGLASSGGTLNKLGAGTLTLTGPSTYTGTTTLTAGTLRVANSTNSATGLGNVTLNAGTLASGTIGSGGNGAIGGSILAGTAAHTIAPGGVGTMGTLSVGGGITSNNFTTFNFDLGSPVSGSTYAGDLINLTGASGLTVGSGTQLAFASNPTATGNYRLFQGSNLGSTALANFTLPSAPNNTINYILSTSADPGYLDLAVLSGLSQWNTSGGGSWPTSGNWTNGVPSTAGSTAVFDNSLGASGGGMVTLDGNQTIGHLQINNGLASYTLAAGTSGMLTIDNSGANSTGAPSIDVLAGSHTISAPVSLAAGVTITTFTDPSPSAPSLIISGAISGSGDLTKAGAGTLRLSAANNFSGTTRVQNGTLVLGTLTGANVGSLSSGTSIVLGSGSGFGIFQLGDTNNPVNQTVASLTSSGTGTANAVVGGNSANSTLTINNSSPVSDAGALGGSATNQNNLALTKSGAGALTLSGQSSYYGPTTISAGVLRVGASSTATTLIQNGSFETPALGTNSFTYYSALSSAQKTALIWTRGATTSQDFALINNSSAWGYTTPYPDGAQAISVQNDATLSQNVSFPGPGSYTLTWSAEARPGYAQTPVNVLLDGATVSTFTTGSVGWSTFVTTLQVASAGNHTVGFAGTVSSIATAMGLDNVSMSVAQGSLSPFSAVQLTTASAALDLNDFSATIGSLAGDPGSTVALGSGALSVGFDGTSTAYPGTIGDGGGLSANVGGKLIKVGGGTLTLSGANNYTGGTTLGAGTLSLGSSGAIGSSGPISFTGGTLQFTSANASDYSGRFSAAANQAYSIDTNSQNVTFAAPLTSSGGTLTKLGAGTLTLTAANTFTGTTTVSAGTLQLGDGTTGHDGSVAGNIVNNAALVFANQGSVSYAGQISGTAGITKTGAGVLTFSGAHSYAGATTVSGGTLRLSVPAAPSGVVSHYNFNNNSAADSGPGGNSGTLVGGPTFVTNLTSKAINFAGSNQYVSVPYSSSLGISGDYTVSFWENLNADYAGQGTASPTFFSTRTGGGTGLIDIQLSSTGLHGDISNVGTGYQGADADATLPVGTWNMVTYSLMTTSSTTSSAFIYVNGALVRTVPLAGTPRLMNSSNTLTLGSQPAVDPSTSLKAQMDEVNVISGALTATQVAALYTNGLNYNLPATTPLTLASGATLDLGGTTQPVSSLNDATLGSGGSITNSAATPATLAFNSVSGTATFSGTISDTGGSGTVAVAMFGTGTQVLAGANTYSGGTTINAGTLQLSGAGTLSASSGALALSGGVLDLHGTSQAVGNLSGTGGTILNSASALAVTLTIGNGGTGGGTFSGLIADNAGSGGTVALAKVGAGTITLAGANTYSGGTTVGGTGTLRVANTTFSATGSGNVTLDGGTLASGPVGAISGNILAGATGAHIIAPGGVGTIGTLSAGGITSSSLTTFNFDLGTTPTSGIYLGDLINLTNGGLSVGSGTHITFASNPAVQGDYRLFGGNVGSAAIGNFSLPMAPMGLAYKLDPTVDSGYIDLVVGPGIITSLWNSTSAGSWSAGGNWTNGVPGTAGSTAIFDNGLTGTATVVTLDANQSLGHLQFNNGGVSYTIAPGGGTLTIDNNVTGFTGVPSIDVTAGSHTISAPVALANGVTITTSADPGPLSPALTISGAISGSGGLIKAGLGTLQLSSANSYSGGTTVSAGALRTTADGALNGGSLSVNPSSGPATVRLSSNESVSNLSSAPTASATALLTVDAGKTLNVGTGNTNAQTTVTLGAGSIVNANSGLLEIDGVTNLGAGSALNVNGGATLKFNLAGANPTVGTGVVATIASGATLELAGTTSALADPSALSSPGPAANPTQRAEVQNGGTLQIDDGAAQQVGGIDGSGGVVVSDTTGANPTSLTADHINQTSLVIGAGSVFTLAPSNSDGNPLASVGATGGGLILAGSLVPSSGFVTSAGRLLSVAGSSGSVSAVSIGSVSATSISAVPEPASSLLLGLGALGLFTISAAKRKRFAR